MLEFQHVSKTFKSQEVLHDISMEIHDGEFVVLIGPSGCGKTTTENDQSSDFTDRWSDTFKWKGYTQ